MQPGVSCPRQARLPPVVVMCGVGAEAISLALSGKSGEQLGSGNSKELAVWRGSPQQLCRAKREACNLAGSCKSDQPVVR